jgi:hypothetical protein
MVDKKPKKASTTIEKGTHTHKKSTSNVEEFAFSDFNDNKDTDSSCNFDVQGIITAINEIKRESSKETKRKDSTTSEKKLKACKSNSKKKKDPSKSAQVIEFDSKLDSLVTQVDEKIDIQNLTNIEEIKDYYEYTENCMQLISKLTMPDIKEIEHLLLDLPEKLTKKKLAIFDLDETLVHCELKQPQKAEKLIQIKLPSGAKTRVLFF